MWLDPKRKQSWRQCEFLAIDLELTGLQPGKDHIVSMGWVPIQCGVIRCDHAEYHLVRPPTGVGQSAVIHRLSDGELTKARSLAELLPAVHQQLQGRVLLAHHAAIEARFLRQAFAEHGIGEVEINAVDTLQIEKRCLEQRSPWPALALQQRAALTLESCCRRRSIPRRRQHHALADALSCAELFLAQAWAIGGDAPLARFSPIKYSTFQRVHGLLRFSPLPVAKRCLQLLYVSKK